jgi:Uncharacterized conserved protein
MLKQWERLLPGSEWCAAGIGKFQSTLNEWCILSGGHIRTGMEDNVRLNRHTLAPSNASLVKVATKLCEKYERPIATLSQTRSILGLKLANT